MSIWSELLFLHGHLTRVPEASETAQGSSRSNVSEEAERLRELWGCRSATTHRPEPPGPLPGVRGLA